MPYRRFRHQLRQQNWVTIGLNLIVVVLGVFVGIQAANWNEARIERDRVRGHLSEIAEDLRKHLAYDEELQGSARLRIAAVDHIYREAFDSTLPTTLLLATEQWQAPPAQSFPPERLDNLMGAVNLVRISIRSRSGYESLISSGRLGLLKNRELARHIQAYYGDYDDLLETQTLVVRVFRNDGAREQYPLGLSVFDQRPASEIIALARENPGFAAYLRSQREWAILQYNLLQNTSEGTATLLAAIDRELASP